jgi:hypothetical protein
MCHPDPDRVIVIRAGMSFDPSGRIVHSLTLSQRAGENRHRQAGDANGFGLPKEMNAQVRLIAQPGIAVPDPAGHQRIVISGNDENGARIRRAFQYCECPSGVRARYAVIVEYITRNENEVDVVFARFRAQLLERSEPGFTDAITGAFLKSSDPQPQVQIRSVQEFHH